MNKILWSPHNSRQNAPSHLERYIIETNKGLLQPLNSPQELYDWSVANPEAFWESVLEFSDIKLQNRSGPVLKDPAAMPGARWFPDCSLNFAENLLDPARSTPEKTAIIFRSEDKVARELSYESLLQKTTKLASYFTATGLQPEDRVAAICPNCPEAIIGMLAATSQGAIWSSCSPDFGTSGILDRFSQIEPKVLLVAEGYYYKGTYINILPKVQEVLAALPCVESVIVFSIEATGSLQVQFPHTTWQEIQSKDTTATLSFPAFPFNHPLYILFSSGTTGKPKCIVHGAGGTLLEHKKELLLHTNISDDDVFFYATTCGWMMWNWLVSGLSCGATLVLYDGFPLLHEGKILFELAEETGMTIFGTSAGYLSAIQKAGLSPGKNHNLNSLRSILSTGSVLAPQSFDFVYEEISDDVMLASISGGTDIVGCFALGCSDLPVRRGELQTRSFGCAVAVYNDLGEPVVNQKGELVCTAPFPSMPIFFWNDPDGERYKQAYFSRFPGVWCHGDYVELTETGGMIFYGRSDAILNPGGVRIGTAEIYRQLERFCDIQSAVVVGRRIENDEEVVLFIQCAPGKECGSDLVTAIKQAIRSNASPRHVPRHVIQVAEIPVTRSGKISEIAVRKRIHGEAIDNKEALANPESLSLFSPAMFLQT